jgi:hypothetical protein
LAVLVGTSTLSDDGSIAGMYNKSLRLASQTYNYGAVSAETLKRATSELVTSPEGSNNSGQQQQQQPSPNGGQQQQQK